MKKRKAAEADESSAKSANGNNAAGNVENDDHTPLTLDEIKASIKDLCAKVPTVPPEGIDAKDSDAVRAWALVSHVKKLLVRIASPVSMVRQNGLQDYWMTVRGFACAALAFKASLNIVLSSFVSHVCVNRNCKLLLKNSTCSFAVLQRQLTSK